MLVVCQQLDAKLRSLYETCAARSEVMPRVRSDTELGVYLGLSKATVSTWRNGNAQKGRVPFKVTPGQLDALTEVVAICLGVAGAAEGRRQGILAEARNLLTTADAETFRRHLRAIPTNSLLSVLEEKPATLEISVKPAQRGFSISPEQFEPTPEEVVIGVHEPFTVHVSSSRRRLLVVLGSDGDGWTWLVPGPTHDGKVTGSPERIPSKTAWSYNSGSGPGAFTVIELPENVPIHPRRRGEPSVLTDERRAALISVLTDPIYKDRWSWGRRAFFLRPATDPERANAVAEGSEKPVRRGQPK